MKNWGRKGFVQNHIKKMFPVAFAILIFPNVVQSQDLFSELRSTSIPQLNQRTDLQFQLYSVAKRLVELNDRFEDELYFPKALPDTLAELFARKRVAGATPFRSFPGSMVIPHANRLYFSFSDDVRALGCTDESSIANNFIHVGQLAAEGKDVTAYPIDALHIEAEYEVDAVKAEILYVSSFCRRVQSNLNFYEMTDMAEGLRRSREGFSHPGIEKLLGVRLASHRVLEAFREPQLANPDRVSDHLTDFVENAEGFFESTLGEAPSITRARARGTNEEGLLERFQEVRTFLDLVEPTARQVADTSFDRYVRFEDADPAEATAYRAARRRLNVLRSQMNRFRRQYWEVLRTTYSPAS